ncbi:MAG TPA: tetratricopeptide repeat protein [Polyangiales bacterium]|nr:tetratricopeptide repeat protein [Polyangiales bacterium]
MSSGATPAGRRTHAWSSGAALGLIALIHLPSVGFGFLDWDDPIHVTKNPSVLTPAAVPLRDHLTTPALGYPIPISVASYGLELQLLGPAPWHFHLINVVLHALNCVLLLGLARRLGLHWIGATCAVLLFGLHPVVAEPVSWVTGRKDVLATSFGLLMLWLAHPPSNQPRRAAALLCYALGLLSKPTIAPLVLLLGLLEDRSRSQELRARALHAARTLAPYLLVLVPVIVLGVIGQRAAGAIGETEHAGAGYARGAWYALGMHLRLILGLEEPTAKYLPLPWPPPFTATVDLLPLAAAAGAALGLRWLAAPQRRAAGFGLLWAVLTYLPNSNLIPLVRYVADSYVYLPLIGCALYTGALADGLVARVPRLLPLFRVALPALVLFACLPAFARSQARFRDDRALWVHALRRYPYNPRLCRQWANGVVKRDGPAQGLSATELCVKQFGDELFAKNKGMLLGRLGRFDEAKSWLERALERHPNDASVRAALASLAQVTAQESPRPAEAVQPPAASP